MPSPAELLRIQQERLARRPDLAHLRLPSPDGDAPPARGNGGTMLPAPVPPSPAIAERVGDTLRLMLPVAPRTKKNGTTLGVRQSEAYRRYRDQVIELLEPIVLALQLPLPDQHYNIAAVYYVDRRGERADKVGLDQGLYDALENAGVISNDWFFRTADGSHVVCGDAAPRVELVITPHPDSP